MVMHIRHDRLIEVPVCEVGDYKVFGVSMSFEIYEHIGLFCVWSSSGLRLQFEIVLDETFEKV